VLQETNLFTGTIRDNIAFGRPDATDDEVISRGQGRRRA
jgi:ABC-type multidrug transport system fused ATPase/permease subunit